MLIGIIISVLILSAPFIVETVCDLEPVEIVEEVRQ